MNYVPYAIPFFVIAVISEFAYGYWRKNNSYGLSDTINSLQLGTLSRLRGVLQLGIIGISYRAISDDYALLNLDPSNVWIWAAAFVAYDLCYYFSHRYGHEWRILWASHVVHHQSEEFNLSTALRQTGTGWLNSIFYLPMYVIGVPVELMISVGSLNLIYQFWVHTEHVRRIGWLEQVLVTPSNHRVHHAKNPGYIDRNYGGVFIIWDRLFGTFQDELVDEPCRYGITRQLNSWNPLWANFHVWYDGLVQSWQTPKFADKFRLWFKSPAWDAPGITYPSADWHAEKFDPQTHIYPRMVSFVHFWPHVGSTFALLAAAKTLGEVPTLAIAAWLTLGFVVQGMLLEGRRWAAYWELARIALGAVLAVTVTGLASIQWYLFAYLVISSVAVFWLFKTEQSAGHLQSPG